MVVLAGEILKEVKEFVEQGVSTQVIIKGLRRASGMAVNKVKEISVSTADGNKVETLRKLAATAMSSKLIHRNADFFTKSKQVVLYVATFANRQQWWLMLSFHSIKTTSTKSSLV